jgi:hypothetical protein
MTDTDARAAAVTPERTEVLPQGREATAHRDRAQVLAREQAEFGGMRFYLAFFGWLTATGTAVLLTAVITGVLALIGVQTNTTSLPTDNGTIQTAGIASGIVLAVVLLLSYYVGGYVAARMARFSGVKQGLAVWLWAIIIAVLATVAGAIIGNNAGVFTQLNSVNLPVDGSIATTAGLIALGVAVVFSLAGALLGGMAGMRFHRKVDRFAANA